MQAVVKGGGSGPAIAWGNSRGSLLYQRVTATDRKLRMPPAGTALSPKQIALISVWIDAGAGTVGASVRVDYVRDVEPILRISCLGCHSGPEAKSQLRLDVKSEAMRVGPRGLVIVPGAAGKSRMIHRVEGRGKEPRHQRRRRYRPPLVPKDRLIPPFRDTSSFGSLTAAITTFLCHSSLAYHLTGLNGRRTNRRRRAGPAKLRRFASTSTCTSPCTRESLRT